MYVLFIPSFPNNRFHLGNIRNKSKQKEKKRRKKEDEQEAEVQSLRYKPIAHIVQFDVFANIFVTFCLIFCFYILYDDTRVTLIRVCLSLTKTFVSFRFLSFLRFFFFGKPQKSLCPGDLQKWQRLELLFVLGFVVAGKQHVAVRATQEVRLFFRHVVLFVFFFPSVGVSPYDFFFRIFAQK